MVQVHVVRIQEQAGTQHAAAHQIHAPQLLGERALHAVRQNLHAHAQLQGAHEICARPFSAWPLLGNKGGGQDLLKSTQKVPASINDPLPRVRFTVQDPDETFFPVLPA